MCLLCAESFAPILSWHQKTRRVAFVLCHAKAMQASTASCLACCNAHPSLLNSANNIALAACTCCCTRAGPGGTTANYYGDCYSNLFAQDDTGRVTVPDRPGMWCPDIVYRRPTQNGSHVSSTVCELNAASLLTSYHGCLCTSPLVPYYYVDTSGVQCPFFSHNKEACRPDTVNNYDQQVGLHSAAVDAVNVFSGARSCRLCF